MAKTNADHQRAFIARKKNGDQTRATVWLTPTNRARLSALCAKHGATQSQVLSWLIVKEPI